MGKQLSEEILRAISPQGLAASIAAIDRLNTPDSDRRAALERQHQQLHNEAQRAFDQFDRVDPANRLVADVLEQRWNTKLEALKAVQGELAALGDTTVSLSDAERKGETLGGGGRRFKSSRSDQIPTVLLPCPVGIRLHHFGLFPGSQLQRKDAHRPENNRRQAFGRKGAFTAS